MFKSLKQYQNFLKIDIAKVFFFADVDQLTSNISSSNLSGATPKFIKDTTSYWYKPDITRKQV